MSRARDARLCLGTQRGFVGKVLGWNRLARRAERACQALAPRGARAGGRDTARLFSSHLKFWITRAFALGPQFPCGARGVKGETRPRLRGGWKLSGVFCTESRVCVQVPQPVSRTTGFTRVRSRIPALVLMALELVTQGKRTLDSETS